MTKRLLCEVFKTPSGVVTVTTNYGGGGTRLCGIKLHGSGSEKIAEFYLDAEALEAIENDLELCEETSE